MEPAGIDWTLIGLQLFNLLLIIAWVVLALMAFARLRSRQLPAMPAAVWGVLILFVPILGALACLLIYPAKT